MTRAILSIRLKPWGPPDYIYIELFFIFFAEALLPMPVTELLEGAPRVPKSLGAHPRVNMAMYSTDEISFMGTILLILGYCTGLKHFMY